MLSGGEKLKPHSLQLLCIQNKERCKFNVFVAVYIFFQRYCLQTNVMLFEKQPVLVEPLVCYTFLTANSSLEMHKE